MPDTPVDAFFREQALQARQREPEPSRHRVSVRAWMKVTIAAGLTLVVLAGGVAAAGYLEVSRIAGSIPRIHDIAALDADAGPASGSASVNMLLTGTYTAPPVRSGSGPLGASQAPQDLSGLIALVHLNADGKAGGIVSIPPNAVVAIPGHGRRQLWDALSLGGPSLLIETVEHLTGLPIEHYSVLSFTGAARVISAMNGVDVSVPAAFSSQGHYFPAGINHLTSATVLPYVRQDGVSEIGRVQLQQNLIRSMLARVTSEHLLTSPASDYRLLHALASALAVDSDFSNSQLESLALRLGHLSGGAAVFVIAPTATGSATTEGTSPVRLQEKIANRLWAAIGHGTLTAFARQYPDTITPSAPG